MAETKGTLSINSDNIFPIIKKWLYSDHDIFFRELISNGCDAITKLKKLDMMGEYNFPEGHKNKVEVILDPEKKTLKFIDTGLGMTADEVEKYITQIAFSGATQFLEQYKDKTEGDQIIGHFGLGFYSAFMVADEVTIDTLSYKEGAKPVHWTCDGGTEYTMATGTKETVGTEITLFLNEESTEFANEYRAREIIEKYCSFMPTEIFLSVEGAEQEFETIPEDQVKDDDVVVEHIHEDAKTEEKENEDGTKETIEVSPAKDLVKINKRPVSLSDTHPLWNKRPNECTDNRAGYKGRRLCTRRRQSCYHRRQQVGRTGKGYQHDGSLPQEGYRGSQIHGLCAGALYFRADRSARTEGAGKRSRGLWSDLPPHHNRSAQRHSGRRNHRAPAAVYQRSSAQDLLRNAAERLPADIRAVCQRRKTDALRLSALFGKPVPQILRF